MQLIDTHCHIHSPEFYSAEEAQVAFNQAVHSGVTKIVCVGTSLEDSRRAVEFAHAHPENCWASVGIHPHEATKLTHSEITEHLTALKLLAEDPKVVAIGECGFDFYYNDKKASLKPQEALLRGQMHIAVSLGLPLSFHVREAFDEFWRVFDDFSGITGILHSFTDRADHLERAIERNLLIGINGIATFTTHIWQLDLFKLLPLGDFVLETDAPFLTPKPKRGNINTPESVIYITQFLAELRGETAADIAHATTASAMKLLNLT